MALNIKHLRTISPSIMPKGQPLPRQGDVFSPTVTGLHLDGANVFPIEPVRTYATQANAIKAVEKALAKVRAFRPAGDTSRLFNVAILPAEGGRWWPLIMNTGSHAAGMQAAIAMRMNVVN